MTDKQTNLHPKKTVTLEKLDKQTNLHPKNDSSVNLKLNIIRGNIPDKAVTLEKLDKQTNLHPKTDKQTNLHPKTDKQTNLHPKNDSSVNLKPNIISVNIPDKAVTLEKLDQNLQDTINGKQDKGDYALKSDIPTKTSQLANNSGYLISSDLKTSVSVVSNPYDDPDDEDDDNTMTSLVVSVGGVSASTLTDELKVAYAKNAYSAQNAVNANNATNAIYTQYLGTSTSAYSKELLDIVFEKKQDKVKQLGNDTTPVYVSADGTFSTCTDYSNASVKHADSADKATNAGYASALGDSNSNYTKATLDTAFNAKQDKVKQLGNAITPIYVSANGTFSACTDYSQASVKHADNATEATHANTAGLAGYASALGEPDSYHTKATLDSALNGKQNVIPATGSATEPVYFSNNGTIAKASAYAGGTKVKLNGSDQGGRSVSFYAPTSYGGNPGYVLTSGESASVPPHWANPSSLSVGSASYASALGDSNSNYTKATLDSALNAKQSVIPKTGSSTKPVYFSGDGQVAKASTYAGGTKVTLNGGNKGGKSASFYAPTSNGTFGYVLTAGEGTNVPPTWTDPSSISVGYANNFSGFGKRNDKASWGTVTAGNGYTIRYGVDLPSGGGLIIAEKDEQTSVQIDGSFYVNEGRSKVATESQVNAKQDRLVSGTNLKTVNGTSLLGSGNIAIAGNIAINSIDIVYNNQNVVNGTFYNALTRHKAVLGVYYVDKGTYGTFFYSCVYYYGYENQVLEQTSYSFDIAYYRRNSGLVAPPNNATIRIIYID